MPSTPVAYNPSLTPISGTQQVGNLAVGTSSQDYSRKPGGVVWWMSPDHSVGYVIAAPNSGQPNGTADSGTVRFWRSKAVSDASFLALANKISKKFGGGILADTTSAYSWLNTNGYWTTFTNPTTTTTTTAAPSAEFIYDPGNLSSYSGSGNVLNNVGSLGNVTGAVGTISGVAYQAATAGGAFNFDGASDVITFGQHNFGNTLTVNAWVYPRTEYSINTLMSNCVANTNTNGFKMAWNNWNTTNYTMNFEAGNSSAGGTASTATNTVSVNAWQMLTFVFNKTTPSIKFYRNGTEIATASGGSPVSNIGTNNSNWWIGAIGGNSYQMNANVGQFKIWKSIRSGAEILAEYNSVKSRYGL